jgi:hypothetical protein
MHILRLLKYIIYKEYIEVILQVYPRFIMLRKITIFVSVLLPLNID